MNKIEVTTKSTRYMLDLTLMTSLSNPSFKAYMNSQAMNRKSNHMKRNIESSTLNTIYFLSW